MNCRLLRKCYLEDAMDAENRPDFWSHAGAKQESPPSNNESREDNHPPSVKPAAASSMALTVRMALPSRRLLT